MTKASSNRRPTEAVTMRRQHGWTSWQPGVGEAIIESIWWEARPLHFPKDNVSHWYDGSELVGIELWGCHGAWWTMKPQPADWTPRPDGWVEAAEQRWQEWHASRTAAQSPNPRHICMR